MILRTKLFFAVAGFCACAALALYVKGLQSDLAYMNVRAESYRINAEVNAEAIHELHTGIKKLEAVLLEHAQKVQTLQEQTNALRVKMSEAQKNDKSFNDWACVRLPDAAVRLLTENSDGDSDENRVSSAAGGTPDTTAGTGIHGQHERGFDDMGSEFTGDTEKGKCESGCVANVGSCS